MVVGGAEPSFEVGHGRDRPDQRIGADDAGVALAQVAPDVARDRLEPCAEASGRIVSEVAKEFEHLRQDQLGHVICVSLLHAPAAAPLQDLGTITTRKFVPRQGIGWATGNTRSSSVIEVRASVFAAIVFLSIY